MLAFSFVLTKSVGTTDMVISTQCGCSDTSISGIRTGGYRKWVGKKTGKQKSRKRREGGYIKGTLGIKVWWGKGMCMYECVYMCVKSEAF